MTNFQSSISDLTLGDAGSFLGSGSKLHHLGIVVRSILDSAAMFSRAMSLRWDGQVFHDPIQQVRVSFFVPNGSCGPFYELVEPAADTSPVSDFSERQGGLHHVCYEVDRLEQCLDEARKKGFVILCRPVPAVAFENRRIAWIGSRWRLTIELLERCGEERSAGKGRNEPA